MSNEYRLRCNAYAALDQPLILSSVAEISRRSEVRAAIAIQSHWRAFIVRRNVESLVSACSVMQSGFRGHCGRKRARKLEARASSTCRERYFRHAALQIQRRWRGYVSRKRVHCFDVRRQYLSAVGVAGQQLLSRQTKAFEHKVHIQMDNDKRTP
mmetsp:Transcript_12232/g.47547  ORF Transcript_12232/g.47547 Transcript_12232/m.47547 type:complete len:155 (+) Transcript_12232:217-681(+)